MKKRLISVLIALGILLPLFPAGKIFAESTVNYNFLVATVEVTNKNASDILGDGNFSYDAAKNVLHVKGGLTREKNLISNRCDGLTVYVERDVTLDSGKYATIVAERDIKITGPGKLTLKTGDCCIYTRVGSTLTIENANIESTSCRSGICGDKEGERLVIRNSTVHLKGDICAFAHFGSFTLDDCDIVYPTGGTIYNGTVIDSSSNVAKEVALAHKFQLWVGGEQVNSYNSTDILGDGQFAYNIGENLLYVKREKTFSRGSAIENRIPGLEICVLRNTTLTAPTGLSVYADTIISGLYKLTLTGTETGIFVRNSATLTVKTDLDVS
ncbi:MAG: hypothetical protein IJQ80_07080, partial [Clostridia bacterium]|nr:hypothetical protein [Clostridia bacterium]